MADPEALAAGKTEEKRRAPWPAHLALLLGLAVIAGWYARTFGHWRVEWAVNDFYSQAPLVPVLAGIVVWLRRKELREALFHPSWWGLPVLCAAGVVKLASTWMSTTGQDAFASVSFPVLLWGLVLSAYGPAVARIVAGPAALLWFMCPLPGYFVSETSFPLQLLSTKLGAGLAGLLGAGVYREGTIIQLPTMSLFVDVACSGLKSALSLLTLTGFAAATSRLAFSKKLLLFVSAVPIALVTNAVRIASIAWAADRWGRERAVWMHEYSGLLLLAVACLSVIGLAKVLGWLDETDTW